jgi:hypothetical protein
MREEGTRTIVRITKSYAKYCAFLSVAGVSKVWMLLRAIDSSSHMALERVISARRRRAHLGCAEGGGGGMLM